MNNRSVKRSPLPAGVYYGHQSGNVVTHKKITFEVTTTIKGRVPVVILVKANGVAYIVVSA